MPEPKNPKPRTTRQKKTAKQPLKENLCHIHDKVGGWEVDDIRENVCVSVEEAEKYELREHITQFEGKHYCLFHLPIKEKDNAKFEAIFQDRLEKTDKQCDLIKNEYHDNQIKLKESKKERNIIYDFRYMFFPSKVKLTNHEFRAKVVFKFANFNESANFNSAVFEESVNFDSTVFEKKANFTSVTFRGNVLFKFASLNSKSIFSSAIFYLSTDFSYTFFNETLFAKSIFNSDTKFVSAIFKDVTNFKWTSFNGLANFRYAIFDAKVCFNSANFKKLADFNYTNFNQVTSFISTNFYLKADFKSAKFLERTIFSMATFNNLAYFKSAIFSNYAIFSSTVFSSSAYFDSVVFGKESNIFFRNTLFESKAYFQYCTSEGYLHFGNLKLGKKCKFDFQEAAFEKANRISFHTLRLEPNWFVNVDSRKFVFTDIDWGKTIGWRDGRSFKEKLIFAAKCVASGFRQVFWKSDEILSTNIDGELKRLEERGIKDRRKRLLEIAYRQLSVNAEENNRYSEASQFRYMAMETKRLVNKGIWRFLNLHWFYKWTSGYGESWRRALVVLLGLLLLFSLVYISPVATFDHGEKKKEFVNDAVERQIFDVADTSERFKSLSLGESAYYSLAVSALQKPEPKPADSLTKILVILQTILAPLQAALLALAIRRKFMR